MFVMDRYMSRNIRCFCVNSLVLSEYIELRLKTDLRMIYI